MSAMSELDAALRGMHARGAERTRYVEVSERRTALEPIPFTGRMERRPGQETVSRIYGPFTPNGAERVARRALRQVSDDVHTYPSGVRYVSGDVNTRVVTIHARMPFGRDRVTKRNMPADVDTRPLDCARLRFPGGAEENHSRDRVTVWHGAATPYLLCGFHASRLSPELFRRLALPQSQGTIWVCMDCLQAEAYSEEPIGRPVTEPETWSLIPEGTEVTMGLVDTDHECDGDPYSGECSCETRELSWSRCEGCGSTLGGSRYAFTIWS